MSQTSTISSIHITSIEAVQAAVEELKRRGVKIELGTNAEPRAWSRGQLPVAPYLLQLPECRFDVGLYESEKNGVKGYTPKCDLHGGLIADHIGVPQEKGVDSTQAQLGKFMQEYVLCATEREAFQRGYQASRVPQQDGSVQLVISGAA